jgi:hypothetical protein
MITYFVLWCYLLIQGMAHNTGVLPLAKGGALQAPQGQDQQNQGHNDDEGYVPSKGHITAMIQPVPS